MAFSESFLSNAGWLFFAAWSALLTAISIAAFGRDLLPWTNSAPNSQSSNPPAPHPHQSR